MKCRHCGAKLGDCFVDLGSAPPSNAYLSEKQMAEPELWYPLKVMVCSSCWLVQTVDFAGREKFFDADYAYFSSFSSTWLDHAKNYVSRMKDRFALNGKSHVVEVAANDGYLLQFVKELQIPCLGIEPTKGTAAAARQKGIDIVEEFFGVRLAEELKAKGRQADLMVANNVLAHVPDINDFVSGFALLLKKNGTATFEFPHLLNLVAKNQFDTIYHEHFSYLSLTAVCHIFEANGLTVYDVEELPTHGGSLRVFAKRQDSGTHKGTPELRRVLANETDVGICSLDYYKSFQENAEQVRNNLLQFLITAKNEGKKVAAYGAAAKGNTLLNFAGIRPDLVSFVADKNPAKQGRYMPGSRIPITGEEQIQHEKPDYVLVLPWNLKEEITSQLRYVRQWNCQFVTAIPELTVV